MRPLRPRVLAALLALPLACKDPPPPPPPAPAIATEGEVTFQSTPPGATVELDGKPLSGVTPLTLKLPAGKEHTARFLLDGYEPGSASFSVQLSPYTAQAELKKASKLQVASEPPGAQVAVDGHPLLAATPGEVPVTSGEHVLTLQLEGYAPLHVKVRAGQQGPLSLKLTREAYLRLTSQPDGAAILLDGVDLALVTPQEKLAVPAGAAHTLLLRREKLASDPVRVKPLKPGELRKLEVTLRDQDQAALQRELRRVKDELAHWQAEQRKYQKADEAFFVKNAKKAKADADHLKEADAKVDELSNQLADLTDRLEALQ